MQILCAERSFNFINNKHTYIFGIIYFCTLYVCDINKTYLKLI